MRIFLAAESHKDVSSSPQYFPGLDLLRSVAIGMVILVHAREILSSDFTGDILKRVFNHGWAGVDLFFVLSGFLIGSQLIQAVIKNGSIDFRRFYLKRAFRILPAFYVVLAFYLLWPAFREKPDLDPAWKFFLFVMNYGRDGHAFSHAWSLCVEEHFYLVFPLLTAICAWRPAIFKPELLLFAVFTGVIALRYYLWTEAEPFFFRCLPPQSHAS